MNKISEYIKQDLNIRQRHLCLSEPCIEIGGRSKEFRGLLAHFLQTSIPSGKLINLCHSCNNPGCSNPRHLYWGTARENIQDQVANGTFDSIANRSIAKYGKEQYLQMVKANAKKAREASMKVRMLSEHELSKIKEVIQTEPIGRGRIARLSEKLNVSHTHVRRYLKKLNIQ